MKITYDSDVDILNIELREGPVHESDELEEGFIADYDSAGHIMGFEILDASERVKEPQNLVFESKGHAQPSIQR